jgi:hypothetical protein
MAVLNEPAAHILHAIPTGVMYEEVTEALQNCHSDRPLSAEGKDPAQRGVPTEVCHCHRPLDIPCPHCTTLTPN